VLPSSPLQLLADTSEDVSSISRAPTTVHHRFRLACYYSRCPIFPKLFQRHWRQNKDRTSVYQLPTLSQEVCLRQGGRLEDSGRAVSELCEGQHGVVRLSPFPCSFVPKLTLYTSQRLRSARSECRRPTISSKAPSKQRTMVSSSTASSSSGRSQPEQLLERLFTPTAPRGSQPEQLLARQSPPAACRGPRCRQGLLQVLLPARALSPSAFFLHADDVTSSGFHLGGPLPRATRTRRCFVLPPPLHPRHLRPLYSLPHSALRRSTSCDRGL
jgi:hypothetical protein